MKAQPIVERRVGHLLSGARIGPGFVAFGEADKVRDRIGRVVVKEGGFRFDNFEGKFKLSRQNAPNFSGLIFNLFLLLSCLPSRQEAREFCD